MSIRILIADDDPNIRLLLRRLLEKQQDWHVCGEASNGIEAIEGVEQFAPDIVVMDLAMPVMNGLEAAREIHLIAPNTAMVMFTMHSSPQLLLEARAVGISDVLSKMDPLGERLLPALKQTQA